MLIVGGAKMEARPHEPAEVDEEEYGRCRKHPYATAAGVCPICLRSRLLVLCPDCAHLRPCPCPSSASSSSTSSSVSFDLPKPTSVSACATTVGSVGRMSFLIESEPAFRRSRSAAAFPFHRRRSAEKPPAPDRPLLSSTLSKALSSIWSSSIMSSKAAEKRKKRTEGPNRSAPQFMPRSKSVGTTSSFSSDKAQMGGGEQMRVKSWGWHFSSPIKVFRHSRTFKVVHELSPLCRG